MTDELRERVAVLMLSILPFYHKKIFRSGPCATWVQAAQYRVLWVLKRKGILPMSELGNQLYISKSYMSTLVDLLIRDGYVERIPDTRDRRVINIILPRPSSNTSSVRVWSTDRISKPSSPT